MWTTGSKFSKQGLTPSCTIVVLQRLFVMSLQVWEILFPEFNSLHLMIVEILLHCTLDLFRELVFLDQSSAGFFKHEPFVLICQCEDVGLKYAVYNMQFKGTLCTVRLLTHIHKFKIT